MLSLRIMKFNIIKDMFKCISAYSNVFFNINFLLVAYEEYVFRVILCYIFEMIFLNYITLLPQLIIMGAIFTAVHEFETIIQRFEFLIFSILISWVFVYTHSIILVILIHIIRNYSILCATKYIVEGEIMNANNQ